MRENISFPEHPIHDSPVVQHRRQMARQVWLPLIISIIIILALMVLAVIGTVQGSSQVNHWGNISAVFIILPVLFFGFLLLAVLGGADYGMAKLIKKIPGWMLKAQLFMIKLSLIIRRAADSATKPIIKANTMTTRATTLWDRIFRRKSPR